MPIHRPLIAAALLACCTLSYAAPQFKLTVVGSNVQLMDINNRGDVTGVQFMGSGGFVQYHDGARADFAHGWGLKVNDSGIVLGPSFSDGQYYVPGSGIVEVPAPAPGAALPGFRALNNAGAMAGYYRPGNGSASHAMVYSNGVVTDISAAHSLSSEANDINEAGHVAGTHLVNIAGSAYPRAQAFIYYDGNALRDIGTLGGDSRAHALNDHGVVVGESRINSGYQHAYIYANGVMTDIHGFGDSNSVAVDVNNSGTAVGNWGSWLDGAFVYAEGKAWDLTGTVVNAQGWVITEAMGINDAGQIAGTACNARRSSCVGAILTPVPEPSAYLMLLAGLGLVGAAAWRRRGLA